MTTRIEAAEGAGKHADTPHANTNTHEPPPRFSEISTTGPFLDPEGLKTFPGGWNDYFLSIATVDGPTQIAKSEKASDTTPETPASPQYFRVDSVFNVECHSGAEGGIPFERIMRNMLPLVVRDASGFSLLPDRSEEASSASTALPLPELQTHMKPDLWSERSFKWRFQNRPEHFVVMSSSSS